MLARFKGGTAHAVNMAGNLSHIRWIRDFLDGAPPAERAGRAATFVTERDGVSSEGSDMIERIAVPPGGGWYEWLGSLCSKWQQRGT